MKRKATIHKVNKYGNRTICGLSIFKSAKHLTTHKTMKGVTCENCKGVIRKSVRLDQAAKDARYQKRVSKTKMGTGNMISAGKAGYS